MEIYSFHHENGVKAGCCNYRVSTTYWMADSREEAEQAIEEHTPSGREPHGNCPTCFASMLADDGYKVSKQEERSRSLFAVVNDNPPNWIEDPVVLCDDKPDRNGVYRDRGKAESVRDTVRRQSSNPDINAYKIQLKPLDEEATQ